MTASHVPSSQCPSADEVEESYRKAAKFPILLCSQCGHEVSIPYRRFLASATVEPYWPEGGWHIGWVCDRCGRYTAMAEKDLRWVSDQPVARADRAFWRVEVYCSFPDCRSGVIAHTQTFGETSRKNLGLMIALGSPTPTCEQGHRISREISYPNRVDFVEWNGEAEYLI